jgi:DNA-3-methyladenine glycosylase
MKILNKKFYERDSAIVAKELLGKILVRKLGKKKLAGKIVETEAYYGKEDPASRAYSGGPKYCVKLLYDKPGKALIYNVHNNWLFNIVVHEKGKAGAVLIRALEPVDGTEIMKKNRRETDVRRLTNGPGKLTKALGITKELNGIYVTSEKSEIFIVDNKEKFEIGSSHRIGVTKDLKKKLRFFIKGNEFVSR